MEHNSISKASWAYTLSALWTEYQLWKVELCSITITINSIKWYWENVKINLFVIGNKNKTTNVIFN